MHQERGAHAGAGVGRAGGEVTQLLVKGEIHLAAESVVHPEAGSCGAEQIHLRADGLDVTVTKVEHRRVLEIQVRQLEEIE
jgi:hypothetical protein